MLFAPSNYAGHILKLFWESLVSVQPSILSLNVNHTPVFFQTFTVEGNKVFNHI